MFIIYVCMCVYIYIYIYIHTHTVLSLAWPSKRKTPYHIVLCDWIWYTILYSTWCICDYIWWYSILYCILFNLLYYTWRFKAPRWTNWPNGRRETLFEFGPYHITPHYIRLSYVIICILYYDILYITYYVIRGRLETSVIPKRHNGKRKTAETDGTTMLRYWEYPLPSGFPSGIIR